MGKDIEWEGGEVIIHGYLEYTRYQLSEDLVGSPDSYVGEGRGVRRHDVSVYATSTVGFFVVDLGNSSVSSDQVTLIYRDSGKREPSKYGGLSELAPYLTAGLGTEIALGSNVYLPVGLYVYGSMGTTRRVTLRAGFTFRACFCCFHCWVYSST